MKSYKSMVMASSMLFFGVAWAGSDARVFSQNQPAQETARHPVTALVGAEEPTSLSVPKPKPYPTLDSVGPAFVPKMIIRDPNLPERVPVNR